MRIIEIDDRINAKIPYTTEASYRVSIDLEYPEVIIKREYFYYGYYEHSNDFDNFWYNNTSNHMSVGNLNRASFVTRNFDTEYLKVKEKELIESFYNKLVQHEKDLEEESDKEQEEDCHPG